MDSLTAVMPKQECLQIITVAMLKLDPDTCSFGFQAVTWKMDSAPGLVMQQLEGHCL